MIPEQQKPKRLAAAAVMSLRSRGAPRLVGVAIATLTTVVCHSAPAYAETSGFELGARSGYAFPMGESAQDANLSSSVTGQLPIWLDVGYRLNDNLFLGAYGQYGIGFASDKLHPACYSEEPDLLTGECSASVARAGIQAHYHPNPDAEADIWFGGGLGYELVFLGVNWTAAGQTTETTFIQDGIEFLNLQSGVDWQVGPMTVGHFFSLAIGRYESVTGSCSGASCVPDESPLPLGSIEDKALHQWLFVGLRGSWIL